MDSGWFFTLMGKDIKVTGQTIYMKVRASKLMIRVLMKAIS